MDTVVIVAAGIVTLAAVTKAVVYLVGKLRQIGKLTEAVVLLTREDGWPNGATSLQASHRDLFEKVTRIEITLVELQTAVEQVLIK
jgi:hypothetical protein